MSQTQRHTSQHGFSLVEVLISVAVFTTVSLAIYSSYLAIFNAVYSSRSKLEAVDLANEQLEIIHNLPYADVGISGGIPSGKLVHSQTIQRNGASYDVTITVRNVDDPFDGTVGGTPNDLSPADYKLVEVEINCALCRNFTPVIVSTRVSPKSLETASTNGALFIKVFDANGNPVPDAQVHIVNTKATSTITIDDVTNASGMLQIVDAPPGVNAYDITVSKNGYSTDKTIATSSGNPNPVKPPATVLLQQVTQTSFSIDKISSLTFNSVNTTCDAVPGIDFTILGNKTTGSNPVVYKYSAATATNGAGTVTLPNLEWDLYSVTVSDAAYDVVGMNPVSPINLLPNSNQTVQLVMAPKNPRTLLVTVLDSATNLPLSDVDVTLLGPGYTSTKSTGYGYVTQTDWSGGAGEATSTDATRYYSSDGNLDVTSRPGDVTLRSTFGEYAPDGTLTSSSFDTGAASNFQKIIWQPISQPAQTGNSSVRVQLATNNDGATWNFLGPDGTSGSYYTLANQNIHPVNNGKRYLRYKLFVSTNTTTSTPLVSDMSFTYTTQCTPPGQVAFQGLSAGSYTIHVAKAGYADQDVQVTVGSSWQSETITLLSN